MKIASLYEAQQARALDRVRHSPSSGASAASPPQPAAAPVAHHPGKVIIWHHGLVWCPGKNKRIAPLPFLRGIVKGD
jgi:hypothetical protein